MEPLVAFALAMTVLALSPGPGLAAVLSRSLSAGTGAGLRVVLGLILVDFFFLAIAVAGLSAIASALGPLFQIIKYLAALYLIYIGLQTLRAAKNQQRSLKQERSKGFVSDVVLGSVVTLGNPKAILFYGALLPTFFDVKQLDLTGYLWICAVILTVSLVVYGAYIMLSTKTVAAARNSRLLKRVQIVSGITLIGAGGLIAVGE